MNNILKEGCQMMSCANLHIADVIMYSFVVTVGKVARSSEKVTKVTTLGVQAKSDVITYVYEGPPHVR